MSENPAQQAPVHVIQNNQPATGKSAAGKGVIALVLCAAAFLSAPLLILIPYVGFVPALFSGAAIIVAWSGLRGATHGNGTAVTGLIIRGSGAPDSPTDRRRRSDGSTNRRRADRCEFAPRGRVGGPLRRRRVPVRAATSAAGGEVGGGIGGHAA